MVGDVCLFVLLELLFAPDDEPLTEAFSGPQVSKSE